MTKPRISTNGRSWIVLRWGHPVYGWSYDRCYKTWTEALMEALDMDAAKRHAQRMEYERK